MYRCFPDQNRLVQGLPCLIYTLTAIGWQDDSGNWFHSYGNEPRQRIYLLNSVTSTKTCIDDIRFPGKLASITDAGVPELIVIDLDLESGCRSSPIHHRRARMLARGKGSPIAASDLAVIHSWLILLN
jgi:hypothetical protein